MVGHPRSQTLLRASGHMDVLYAISDSDWATDVESRRSTSCGVLTVDAAVQGIYSRGQTTIAQSQRRGRVYGAASVINEAIGLSGIYDELGIPDDHRVAAGQHSRDRDDSETWNGTSASHGPTSFVLARATSCRNHRCDEKIDTSVNLADVGTKHFTASRLEELKRLLGMVYVVDESVLHAAASVVSAICSLCGSTEVSGRFWRNPAEARIKFCEELSGQKFFFLEKGP